MSVKEDYLRAMYHFNEENEVIRSVDLADYLGISKASVSEMLRRLFKENLIKDPTYKQIELTKKGLNEAISITNRHRIVERFLQDVLKIKKGKIHEEAHKLEHTFSNESISKMKSMLKNPKNCPHGKPIIKEEIKC